MRCLAKTPAERPASALSLEEELGATSAANDWTTDDARRWWVENGEGLRGAAPAGGDAEAMTVAINLAERQGTSSTRRYCTGFIRRRTDTRSGRRGPPVGF